MVGLLKFNIIEKVALSVYLEMPCITFKKENILSPTPGSSGPLLALSVFVGAGQPLQHAEVRDTNLAWVGLWCGIHLPARSAHEARFLRSHECHDGGHRKLNPRAADENKNTTNLNYEQIGYL